MRKNLHFFALFNTFLRGGGAPARKKVLFARAGEKVKRRAGERGKKRGWDFLLIKFEKRVYL